MREAPRRISSGSARCGLLLFRFFLVSRGVTCCMLYRYVCQYAHTYTYCLYTCLVFAVKVAHFANFSWTFCRALLHTVRPFATARSMPLHMQLRLIIN